MIDTPLQQGGYESSKDALKEFGILIEFVGFCFNSN
jgi:hypothetical protein